MSDLIDYRAPGENAPEFSVSDLSGVIKRMIEGEFSHVRVKGEVGRVSRPRSGHVYMDLKDDRSVLAGVIWKGVAGRLAVQPEEGMEVVATGRLTTFPGQSRYQIVIEDLKPAGIGALMAMLEARRKALAGEGLFAPERKKQLPYLPEVIGVVTSPSGAVIRDILHRLRDRFPRKVLIWPVAVQGENCAQEVTNAIQGFNALTPGGVLPRPDLLIVARGGGSIEDLWGFNEESVVRAAAASEIPLISAVGHETDTTLIDFASDKRAPTPTAAAELAVPVRLDLLAWLDGQEGRLLQALQGQVTARRQRLRDLSRALPRGEALLDGPRQRLDGMGDKLPGALRASIQVRQVALSQKAGALRPGMLRERVRNRREGFVSLAARMNTRTLQRDISQRRADFERVAKRLSDVSRQQVRDWRDRLAAQERLRETLGYKATLSRGYAVVRGDAEVVTTKAAAQAAATLEIEFSDGMLAVGGSSSAEAPQTVEQTSKARPNPKPKKPPPEQGSLF